jgi:tRNA (cmo5U34)-methyltransferase
MSGSATAATAATAAFSAHAPQYTALRRRLVPGYDQFYGAVVDVLSLAEQPPRRVLDLGAGTGLLSTAVLAAFPEVSIELLDGSEAMLTEAAQRLGGAVGAVHVADMAAPLPDGPFDAIVSALAIHHLADADKRRLFARIHQALVPGGVFVNAEQVAGPTEELTAIYTATWERNCRALGASDEELDDAHERMRHDRCADVESQLAWLRAAGFSAADCVYKSWRQAVLVGFKEAT